VLPPRYLVVFGRIVRHERIERLVAAWRPDETLVVAGAIGDRAYADELHALARPNVIVHAGVRTEPDAQALVARSAAAAGA
jgi:glycosyltransferase involved in cell wall biosynthesis